MFTKILVYMHLGIWMVSAVLFFGFEYNHYLEGKGFADGVFYSLFMTLTTRNAGFATLSMGDLTDTSQVFFGILMFIGSSPNSAGGGIRTTTLLLTILGILAFARGRDQVVINHKSIKMDTVYKSLMVIIGAATLIVFDLLILSYSDPDLSLQEIQIGRASCRERV